MANSGNVGRQHKLVFALATSLTAVGVPAATVDVIYSAENALYGAGYDIGVADGWMDEQLRSAIRQYQSSRNDLLATGDLDINTLFSLGISTENGAPVTGNQLPNRQAAFSALGMTTRSLPAETSRSTAVTTEPASASDPEPVRQPEPAPDATPAQPGQSQTAPDPATQESAVADSDVETAVTESETSQASPQQAGTSSPDGESESTPVKEPEPTLDTKDPVSTAATPSDTGTTGEDTTGQPETGTGDQQANGSPQSATDAPESPATQAQSGENTSSGGFFSWLYDFFFGWMF